ncbi:hypothetical protein DFJ58DRAFT_812053 [Suillus subalutaceus]|uniref:uncharacterized protein n=1 Tax=Suillus subalutaceus TaxID=48586 RepID=UPI001B873FFB|nr:uncharacterized protein DFJ58DRAFT_812053 [Suillus subalutaceus]KAG1839561.1 hypothetical protein DFJ58DRAFT_812053 [Suillus subalutaceus]
MFDWISLTSKALLLLILVYSSSFMFSSKKWSPKGLHVYITGGSQGLGLALAKLVARKGAHVSIVARNQSKLDDALKELEANRQSPDQVFKAFSFSLNTAEESAAALQAASDAHGGQVPDAVFACAGTAKPMFLLEMQPEDLSRGMENVYWVQAWTAFAAAKRMVRENKKGKIVLVSSTLGYMSLIGYSSYSPAKHALRGLADSLHSELMLYGIDTHIFFPPTMYTPGFEEENKTKPAITRAIESADEGLTADQAAAGLLSGVEKGYAHITADFITSMFRASTRGCTPRSNAALDLCWIWLLWYVGIPIWRRSVDKQVLAHRVEHREYLRNKGLVD